MEEKKLNEIFEILANMTTEEAYEASETIYNRFHTTIHPEGTILTDKAKKIVDEIFKLAQYANCIPITYETQEGSEYTVLTQYPYVSDVAHHLAPSDDEELMDYEGEYIIPYFTDDMTKRQWKKIEELWKKLLNEINLPTKIYNNKEYCESYYVNTHVITKDYSIKQLTHINK